MKTKKPSEKLLETNEVKQEAADTGFSKFMQAFFKSCCETERKEKVLLNLDDYLTTGIEIGPNNAGTYKTLPSLPSTRK